MFWQYRPQQGVVNHFQFRFIIHYSKLPKGKNHGWPWHWNGGFATHHQYHRCVVQPLFPDQWSALNCIFVENCCEKKLFSHSWPCQLEKCCPPSTERRQFFLQKRTLKEPQVCRQLKYQINVEVCYQTYGRHWGYSSHMYYCHPPLFTTLIQKVICEADLNHQLGFLFRLRTYTKGVFLPSLHWCNIVSLTGTYKLTAFSANVIFFSLICQYINHFDMHTLMQSSLLN